MLTQNLGCYFLAEENFGFAIVGAMRMKLDDVVLQMIEGPAHRVKLILRLHNDFVVPGRVRPLFLLFSQRSIMSKPAPFLARTADPAVKDLPVVEIDNIFYLADKIDELEIRFVLTDLVADFVSDGNHRLVIIKCSGHRQQNQVLAIRQTAENLGSGLLGAKFVEMFLHILDFECAGFECVLPYGVFHNVSLAQPIRYSGAWAACIRS